MMEQFFRPFLLWVLSLGALVTITGCESGDASSEPYYHRVLAQPLVLEDSYSVERYFVGQVEARQRAELGFELVGTIAEMAVDEGELVEPGQLLAKLDSRLLRSEIQEIEAQREDIRARLDLATIEVKRARELIHQGFASEQRVDELNAEIASLKAQLKRQQAVLDSAQIRLAKQSLLAPYRGEVSRRYTEVGAISASGQPVFQLLEQGGAEARVGVPARLVSTIQVGAELSVIVSGRQLKAVVLTVGANVDAVTRTSSVRLSLPASENYIDGEMLYLHLPEQIEQAGFWVPDTALGGDVRGMWNLYALVSTEEQDLYKIEARSIQLLHMAGGRAFVQGAVTANEQVLSAGLQRVVPGLLVRLSSDLAQ